MRSASMTPKNYFIARIALAFGIQRRNQRMAEAAAETHLLRDAELRLGELLWEKCENLEEVSVEYWSIRKLIKELAVKGERLKEHQAKLDAAHEERAQTLLAATDVDPEIIEHRNTLIQELDVLAAHRDQVIAKARRLRRSFDGIQAKLDVLIEAGEAENHETINECKIRLGGIKSEFEVLKSERNGIAADLDAKEKQLNELEDHISRLNKERRFDVSKTFAAISEFNQEVSVLNAEIGLLQRRNLELCAEIGRYLSRNIETNPKCAAICKSHRGLVDVMAALRRSISYNHRIAGV
jgi:chromosome segregation ATPase